MPKTAILKVILSRRMLVALIMGYAAGLPLELTGFVLKTWMREEGVDLAVIGLMALVGLPYTLKFIQARCWIGSPFPTSVAGAAGCSFFKSVWSWPS